MRISQIFSVVAIVGFALLLARPALSQIDIGSGLRLDLPERSLRAERDRDLVRQRFDFSCGAAALATILRYGFGEGIDESRILNRLFDFLTEDERSVALETGFSLLDLQRVAESFGYRAAGFRLEPDQLTLLSAPVIVFIEPRGYDHFAVLRGVVGDRAYLADPSRGNIRIPMYRFVDSWIQDSGTGIVFVVEPADGLLDADMPLFLSGEDGPFPEVLAARELMAVGKPGSSSPPKF